jgi:hypothetical protein
MRKLHNLQFSSWINEVLGEVLWSVLIASMPKREKAIAAFRSVLARYKNRREDVGEIMLGHSEFAKLHPEQFDILFADLCGDDEIRKTLAPLLLLESLPDRAHWQRTLGEIGDAPDGWQDLGRAVGLSFDHQSQEATDCRWVRVMTLLARDKLAYPSTMRERLVEMVHYPDRGDMRAVRPHIRASEMTTRNWMQAPERPPPYAAAFWSECFLKTACIPRFPDEGAKRKDYLAFFDEVAKLYDDLSDYFMSTIGTTAIDARHDGSFGLALYILQLLVFALKSVAGQTITGRLIARTALEAYLTLAFLSSKDEPTIWMQYRNYGAGQSKLAYLKNVSVQDLPSFTTRELLESLANEDMWMEFQEINLGAWADKNLRQMADDAGVKDVYDRYYDGLSAYVHANWSATRHAVYGDCVNPLHRFHRVPVPPRFLFQDTVPDLVKISNLALEQIAKLYPPYKPRLRLKVRRVKKAGKAKRGG